MNQKTKKALKGIVKECLMEILAEGLINNQPATRTQTTQLKGSLYEASERVAQTGGSFYQETKINSPKQTVSSQRNAGRTGSRLSENAEYNQQQEKYSSVVDRTVSSITNDSIMSDILKDTAMTTLQEQKESAGKNYQPSVSMSGDAAAKLADQSDPSELFGEVSSNWANLAFS